VLIDVKTTPPPPCICTFVTLSRRRPPRATAHHTAPPLPPPCITRVLGGQLASPPGAPLPPRGLHGPQSRAVQKRCCSCAQSPRSRSLGLRRALGHARGGRAARHADAVAANARSSGPRCSTVVQRKARTPPPAAATTAGRAMTTAASRSAAPASAATTPQPRKFGATPRRALPHRTRARLRPRPPAPLAVAPRLACADAPAPQTPARRWPQVACAAASRAAQRRAAQPLAPPLRHRDRHRAAAQGAQLTLAAVSPNADALHHRVAVRTPLASATRPPCLKASGWRRPRTTRRVCLRASCALFC
jgi:hypothetical protein